MWTRAQLKAKGKMSFKRNYWKVVLVALIVLLISGSGGSSAGSFASSMTSGQQYEYNYEYNYPSYGINEFHGGEHYFDSNEIAGSVEPVAAAVFIFTVLVIFLIVFAVICALAVFVFNPLDIGLKRFFFQNLNTNANVKEIGYGFDHSYKNIVKILFFRDLYEFLWTLLLIIPGIVKAYEYRMIPYLLAEYPDMPKEQAFETSKRMMDGQKWNTFVLDLSFIGWNILSAVTLGIVGIFYSSPYQHMTNAALYEALKNGGQQPQFNQNYYGAGQMYGNPQQPYGQNMYGNPQQSHNQNMYGNPQHPYNQNVYNNPQQPDDQNK